MKSRYLLINLWEYSGGAEIRISGTLFPNAVSDPRLTSGIQSSLCSSSFHLLEAPILAGLYYIPDRKQRVCAQYLKNAILEYNRIVHSSQSSSSANSAVSGGCSESSPASSSCSNFIHLPASENRFSFSFGIDNRS